MSVKPIAGPLVAVLLLAACSSAATPAPAIPTPAPAATSAPSETTPVATTSARIYALADVTLIDVVGSAAIPGQTVIIVGDRIDKIGAQGQVAVPPGAEVIAGAGLYLMPGLVDSHVHYRDAPVFGRVMLANGVLLVRDMGMPTQYILKLRDDLNQGKILGPEMVSAGMMLDGYPPLMQSMQSCWESRSISLTGAAARMRPISSALAKSTWGNCRRHISGSARAA